MHGASCSLARQFGTGYGPEENPTKGKACVGRVGSVTASRLNLHVIWRGRILNVGFVHTRTQTHTHTQTHTDTHRHTQTHTDTHTHTHTHTDVTKAKQPSSRYLCWLGL